MAAEQQPSRRDFLRTALGGAAYLGASPALLHSQKHSSTDQRSVVVVGHDPALRGSGWSLDQARLQALLDRTVHGLFPATGNAQAAWRHIARMGQRIGIKVNTLGGRAMSTSPAVIEAICERLQQAGIRAADIIVWDRQTWELERAGFRIAEGGDRVQCYGSERVGYLSGASSWGSVTNNVSKILMNCHVLINVPILKDHDLSGMTLAMKNMYGVISKPNHYHANGCDPFIADLNMLTEIRQRLRLTIGDATTAIYEGGPSRPGHSWPCNTLLASVDPVAIDYTGWQIIERQRAEKGLQPLEAAGRPVRFLKTAADARHRLGTCDPARIALVEV